MKNCSKCRAELPEEYSYRSCEKCRAEVVSRGSSKLHKMRAERRRAGLCPFCEKEKLPGIQRCKDCYFKHMSYVATGTSRNAQYIRGLLEAQDHKCYLTGETLREGDNASLDHVIPRSHKDYPGDHCLDNLAWTTKDINWVKSKFTKDEFLQICEKVLEHNYEQALGEMDW